MRTRELQRPSETHHLLLSVAGTSGMTDACGQVVDAIHDVGWDPDRWAQPHRGCRQSGDAPDGGTFGAESLGDAATRLDLASVRRFRTYERTGRPLVVVTIRGEGRW